ncbi:MAG: adenylosuccinate synthase [Cyclobacteriaceae bacterium]|nr:adenylosuccinate synthase [Cyclobacteriaceae bacterium]
MAKVDILLGLQWGDEGKGKVVDFLTPKYDIIARFQGGPNAGHTLEFDGKKHVLHQIPSGIFHPGKMNVIGNGVVLDPVTFSREIDGLKPYKLDLHNSLIISGKAQLIIPTHRLLDQAYEKAKGESKIGSTLRGIGPTYQDKMARVGIRAADINEPDFESRYNELKKRHCEILDHYDFDYSLDEWENDFFAALEVLRGFKIMNTEYYLNNSLKEGKSILAEGAQGSLLDIDFGSYPFVTSSNTISAGACTGLGISPKSIGEVFGIFKAYCTRVGSGPFPTELHGQEGEELRQKGREFGATTGRPRRCGWLDIPALNYAVMLNGVTQLFMMKADVLSGLDELSMGTSYIRSETETFEFPVNFTSEWKVKYEVFKGWENTSFKTYDDFPESFRTYIQYIEETIGVPINLVSVGPDRKDTLLKS